MNKPSLPPAHPGVYLAHIDGLRAIAVLAVVFYHLWPAWVPGGFIGVDIFFVISGYLITRIIAGELSEGRFSLLVFYSRRIRRIVPALVLVLVLSAGAGALMMAPQDFLQFARSARNAMIFTSNFMFQRTINYFERGFEDAPLLHTWSLGVEQQFYLLWPLLLIALRRSGRKTAGMAITILGMTSLLYCEWMLRTDPTKAFYSPLTRLWEFALGGAIVWCPYISTRRTIAFGLAAVGLGLMVVPVFVYNDHTPFPGLAALAPCLGTALVIAGCTSHAHRVQRALSMTPVRLVGAVSYSLYLWHWPVLCFYTLYTGERQLSFHEGVGIFGLSLAGAWLSWKYVERPFRKPRQKTAQPSYRPAYFAFAGLLLCIGVSETWFRSVKEDRGWRWRYAQTADLTVFERPYRYPCFFDYVNYTDPKAVAKFFQLSECVSGDEKHVDAILVGDSHAMHYDRAVTAHAKQHNMNLRVMASPGCPALLTSFTRVIASAHQSKLTGRGAIEHAARCEAFIKGLQRYIEDHKGQIKEVFLAQRHAGYTEIGAQKGFYDPNNLGFLTDAKDRTFSQGNTYRMFTEHMHSTVDQWLAQGVKHITILGQIPMLARDPANCYLQRYAPITAITGTPPSSGYYCTKIERDYVEGRLSFANALFVRLANEYPGRVSLVDPLPYFCDHHECSAEQDGQVIYNDSNHLNSFGADYLQRVLAIPSP